MAKLKKESKPVKDKVNTNKGNKQQKPTKAIKPKKLKDKVINKKNIKNVNVAHAVVKGMKVDKKSETKLNLNVDDNQLVNGVKALLDFCDKGSKNLFDKDTPVFAQITSIKIPEGPERRLRLHLKHSMYTDGSEICLIVPDLKRGRKQDHDPTIEHYEELLKTKGVTCVKRILPVRQIKVEYDQFELKRKLCGYYDCFLVDGKLSGYVAHLLGKIFFDKRKLPMPIRLTNSNLKATIETALHKAVMNLHCTGNSYTVQVGNSGMSPGILAENLKSCIEDLARYFPGGWENIRSVHVKTDKSISVPVYLTLKTSRNVPMLKVNASRPKLHQDVRGELSTKLNSEVTVTADGDIIVHSLPKKAKIAKDEQASNKVAQNGVSKVNEEEELMNDDDDIVNDNMSDSDDLKDSDEEDDVATKAEKAYIKFLKTTKKKKVTKKSK